MAWTARRSATVTPCKASGHVQRVTTPTLSPLPSSTDWRRYHSDSATGGAMFDFPLVTRKYWRGDSTPAVSASSALITLRVRADRALASSADPPRPSSTVTSAPPVLRE